MSSREKRGRGQRQGQGQPRTWVFASKSALLSSSNFMIAISLFLAARWKGETPSCRIQHLVEGMRGNGVEGSGGVYQRLAE